MKVKYSTSRETATVLKEWASNCGSALKGNHLPSSLVAMCVDGRSTPVESFMSGVVDINEATPEAVLRALNPAARHIRTKTLMRLAKTISVG